MTTPAVPHPAPGPAPEPAHPAAAHEASVAATIAAFNAAFNERSIEGVARLIADDCVFDTTTPPDGQRFVGRDAVLQAFSAVWAAAAEGSGFQTEESFTSADRAVVRWRYDWVDHDGSPGHVRGVDVFRLRDGLVVEKLSYVKG